MIGLVLGMVLLLVLSYLSVVVFALGLAGFMWVLEALDSLHRAAETWFQANRRLLLAGSVGVSLVTATLLGGAIAAQAPTIGRSGASRPAAIAQSPMPAASIGPTLPTPPVAISPPRLLIASAEPRPRFAPEEQRPASSPLAPPQPAPTPAKLPPPVEPLPQIQFRDGGWQGQQEPWFRFDQDADSLRAMRVEPRFRATVEAVNRLDGTKVFLVGLRVHVEVMGSVGWRPERPYEVELGESFKRPVTSEGRGRYRVGSVDRTLHMSAAFFREQIEDAVSQAIRLAKIRERDARRTGTRAR